MTTISRHLASALVLVLLGVPWCSRPVHAADPPVAVPPAASPATDDDLEKSVQQLQKSLSLFPYNEKIRHDLADAYQALGQRRLKQKRYDEAAENFDQARTLYPDYAGFGVQRGIALYLAKRYDEAAYELERTRQGGGDSVDIFYFLGKIRYDTGDLSGALDVWDQALLLDPENKSVRERAEKARRELKVEGTMGKGYRSVFVISYDEGSMSDLADEVLSALEAAYNRVGSDLSHYPSVKVPVILYTRTDYRSVTAGPEWSGGLYDGKVRLPIGGAKAIDPVLRAVLTHEYAHVVVRELTGGNCPSWLNEGIAEVEGRTEHDPPLTVLKKAVQASAIMPFTALEKSLLGMSGKEAELAYQQSYSMVKYLVSSYGWHKVKDVLLALGSGLDFGAAVSRAFADHNLDYNALVREWQAQVVKEYGI